MEKIVALIDKLQELKDNKASLSSLSYYTQILYAEIMRAKAEEQESQPVTPRKVSVIMPLSVPENVNHHHEDLPKEHKKRMPLEQAVVENPEPVKEYRRPEPVVGPKENLRPESEPGKYKNSLFDEEEDRVPVNGFATAPVAPRTEERKKEINELIEARQDSLNDRLKKSNKELSEKLGDSPVTDLRNAIGINDKFQFIDELFRGDHDMYERSIKTINKFSSLREAEYWMERELKVRLIWLDDNPLVKHFYSLVRKRFS